MTSLVVMALAAAVLGMIVHEIGHCLALWRLRPIPFRLRFCPHGIASTSYFLRLWKYDKVACLAAGPYAEFGFGLTLCTIGSWFSPNGSLFWSLMLLVAAIAWWACRHHSQTVFIVGAPWLLVLLTVGAFFGLARGTMGDSFFDNLLCAGFVPMLSAGVDALPFKWSPRSDGTRIAKVIHDAE